MTNTPKPIHGHPVVRRSVLAPALGAVLLAACGGESAPFDRQFLDMMVPHHEGAVEMAKIAQQRAQRPEIRQMAGAIIGSQAAEIAQACPTNRSGARVGGSAGVQGGGLGRILK